MKKIILTSLSLSVILSFNLILAQTVREVDFNYNGRNYHYSYAVPLDYDSTRSYPMIICFHGAGDNSTNFARGMRVFANDGYLVLCLRGYYTGGSGDYYFVNWNNLPHDWIYVDDVLFGSWENFKTKYNIDESRVFVMGFSMGASMCHYVGVRWTDYVSGIMPYSGQVLTPYYEEEWYDNLQDFPVYIIHGSSDQTIPPSYGRQAYQQWQRWGANVYYLEIPGLGHTFPSNYRDVFGEAFRWLDSNRRSSIKAEINFSQNIATTNFLNPDESEHIFSGITLKNTGSEIDSYTLALDTENLPENWTVSFYQNLNQNKIILNPKETFSISVKLTSTNLTDENKAIEGSFDIIAVSERRENYQVSAKINFVKTSFKYLAVIDPGTTESDKSTIMATLGSFEEEFYFIDQRNKTNAYPGGNINQFKIILWSLGEDEGATPLNENELALMENYLNNGGNLLLFVQGHFNNKYDYGSDYKVSLQADDFERKFLGIKKLYQSRSAGITEMIGTGNPPVKGPEGIINLHRVKYAIGMETEDDAVTLYTGKRLDRDNSEKEIPVGILRIKDNYKVITMTVAPGKIKEENIQDEYVQSCIRYFLGITPVLPEFVSNPSVRIYINYPILIANITNSKGATLNLFDIQGKKIHSFNLQPQRNQINLNDKMNIKFNSGIILYKINFFEGNNQQGKLLILN